MPLLDTFVSVVLPLDNDAAVLETCLLEAVAVLKARYRNYEIICVDDGSTDGTYALLDRMIRARECLRYVRLARRFGTDVAMTAGLDAAIGDSVVLLEPGVDPPCLIPNLVQACCGDADVVIGTSDRPPTESRLFVLGRCCFYWLCRRLITSRLPGNATHLMAFSRRVVNALNRIKPHHRHLGVVACSVGYPTAVFPYEQRPVRRSRRRGLASAVEYAVATLVTNSTSPLRLVTYIGAFAASANLLYMLYICGVNLIKNRVAEGWTTLSLQVSGMFFLVFAALVVIAEYLVQTFQASKGPPVYHVLDERSSLRPFADADRRNVVTESAPERRSA